jgi:hypothetical protein
MCFVPRTYRATIYPDLAQILNFCPRLSSFNHLPPFPPPKSFPFPVRPRTITLLKLSQHAQLSTVYDTLRLCCAQLEELSVYSRDDENFDALELCFPRLHTLYITLSGRAVLQGFSTKWDMPRLERLTFWVSKGGDYDFLAPTYHHLLAIHGFKLKYVAFGWISGVQTDFTPILATCPVVEHIVLPPNYSIDLSHRFPSIKWVDIWFANKRRPTKDEKNRLWYPHIEGPLRFLDTALVPLMDDVPRAFDRELREEWSLAYPGLSISQDKRKDIITIRLMDRLAINEWGSTYFGTIEMGAIEREQEHNVMAQKAHTENVEQLAIQVGNTDIPDNSENLQLDPLEKDLDGNSQVDSNGDSEDESNGDSEDESNGDSEDESEGDSADSWFSLESEAENVLEDEFYDLD